MGAEPGGGLGEGCGRGKGGQRRSKGVYRRRVQSEVCEGWENGEAQAK